jgi:hypothetical protein
MNAGGGGVGRHSESEEVDKVGVLGVGERGTIDADEGVV